MALLWAIGARYLLLRVQNLVNEVLMGDAYRKAGKAISLTLGNNRYDALRSYC